MATSSAATNTNGKNSDMESLEKQISTLSADLSKLTETVKDIGVSRVNALKQEGTAAARKARDAGADAYRQAEESVREHPSLALGIAAGVGFLAGAILARK